MNPQQRQAFTNSICQAPTACEIYADTLAGQRVIYQIENKKQYQQIHLTTPQGTLPLTALHENEINALLNRDVNQLLAFLNHCQQHPTQKHVKPILYDAKGIYWTDRWTDALKTAGCQPTLGVIKNILQKIDQIDVAKYYHVAVRVGHIVGCLENFARQGDYQMVYQWTKAHRDDKFKFAMITNEELCASIDQILAPNTREAPVTTTDERTQ